MNDESTIGGPDLLASNWCPCKLVIRQCQNTLKGQLPIFDTNPRWRGAPRSTRPLPIDNIAKKPIRIAY